MDTRLVHPFTSIVAGPKGCDKTTFVVSLLRHSLTLVNLPPERITWCYGEWQPLYSTLSTIHPNLECVEGLPDVSSFDSKNRNLVVIDDLMSETDERVTKLFTKKSHHCNMSVIYLVQNLFPKDKESRLISINAQYMVLFKNPRDNTQFSETDVSGSCKVHARRIQRRNVRTSRLLIRGNSPHRNTCAFGVISYLTRRRTSMLTFPRYK